ncbi:MAG: hypothetical protein II966_04225 [Lachnospiraceae bacterium]|nr:hypothetical protein [Lachnospiraceae bacterium]
MALNGIGLGNGVDTSEFYTTKAKTATEAAAAENVAKTAADNGTGVVYEKSSDTDNVSALPSGKPKTVDHEAIVAKMKQDAEEQTANLRSIVEKLMLGQSKASQIAGAETGKNTLTNDDDMWKFLAKGDFTVDEATKSQAQADIAEDGYWGVEKTSDRILDFAKALAGNDPSKAQKLLDAFKEGYKKAEETWGDKLPEISQKTYEAVEKKFNDWMNPDAASAAAVEA